MADMPQAALPVEICAACPDFKRAPAEVVVFVDLQGSAGLSKSDVLEQPPSLFGYGDGSVVDTKLNHNTEKTLTQQSLCGGVGPSIPGRQECDTGSRMQQDESGMDKVLSPKSSEEASVEGKAKTHDTLYDGDDDRFVNAHIPVIVDACSSDLSKLFVLAREEKTCEEGQCPKKSNTHTKAPASEQSEDERKQEQTIITPPRKQAGWNTPEEREFAMEDSSWPTLAEACNTKSMRARSPQAHALQPHSPASHKEPALNSFPTERVPSSQANLQECPLERLKHTNPDISIPGSKNRSSYKKDHSVKGNKLMGINKVFTGPHQAPAHGAFYYPRAESLTPFPQNSSVPSTFGRGHSGWPQYGRGYGDASYKCITFMPPYDQQHVGPRHTSPQVTPFMNMNVAYNYPSYHGDLSFVPGAPSPGFNYAGPYFRPPGPPGVMVQAPLDVSMLQETLQKQIEYYFSPENLIYDTFLISKMDDEGYVPLPLIASFPRVRNLTWNTLVILDALKNSTAVEVKNGKLRSHEWRRWKRVSTGTLGPQGSPSGLGNHTGSGIMGNQENGKSEESQHGHLESMCVLSESRIVAGSCAVPWTVMSANVGTVSVPTVTSIGSR